MFAVQDYLKLSLIPDVPKTVLGWDHWRGQPGVVRRDEEDLATVGARCRTSNDSVPILSMSSRTG